VHHFGPCYMMKNISIYVDFGIKFLTAVQGIVSDPRCMKFHATDMTARWTLKV